MLEQFRMFGLDSEWVATPKESKKQKSIKARLPSGWQRVYAQWQRHNTALRVLAVRSAPTDTYSI